MRGIAKTALIGLFLASTGIGVVPAGQPPADRTSTLGAAPPAVRFATQQELSGLRLNQIQLLATHNSYHLRPENPRPEWDYSHAPLPTQLDRGVRSFELDVHISIRGFEVYHLPRFDAETSCKTLKEACQQAKAWSDQHPRHLPILFLVEIKDEGRLLDPRHRPLDRESAEEMDREVLRVFGADRLITPDWVRKEAGKRKLNLTESIGQVGWPTLDRCRGKCMFILHETGNNRKIYTAGRSSLEGRVFFVRSEEGRQDAATMVVDNPDVARISELVRKGYIVRTRADGIRKGARFEERRERAWASGAQIVTTDYPPGEADPDTGYVVELPPGAVGRVNPINGPFAGAVVYIPDDRN